MQYKVTFECSWGAYKKSWKDPYIVEADSKEKAIVLATVICYRNMGTRVFDGDVSEAIIKFSSAKCLSK